MALLENQAIAFATFDDFLEAVRPRLKRLLTLWNIPPEDSEDLLQDSVIALVFRWNQVRDPESWLVGTTRRHCLMYWRRIRRQVYQAVDLETLERLSPSEAPQQERGDLWADLDDLIEQLPERCRQVLHLRFRLGLESTEIARELVYRESSISKITNRCLAALSRKLAASRVGRGLAATDPASEES
jgi:RNA polymerase sigma factor (sigma-70 family)